MTTVVNIDVSCRRDEVELILAVLNDLPGVAVVSHSPEEGLVTYQRRSFGWTFCDDYSSYTANCNVPALVVYHIFSRGALQGVVSIGSTMLELSKLIRNACKGYTVEAYLAISEH